MVTRKMALAAGAASLIALPMAAQAETAIFAPVSGENEIGGESNVVGALIGAAIAAAIVIALVELTDDDDDEPVSV